MFVEVINITTTSAGRYLATVGNISLEVDKQHHAALWADAVCYGYQPACCIFFPGACNHPIADCKNCPFHPVRVEVIPRG